VQLYEFDDDYVRRLREGDRWTEEHFVRYFSELLLIKLRSRLRSIEAIDDVRQEVFMRVMRTLRAPDGLREGRKLGAFVNSVCNNVLFESYRAQGRTVPLDNDESRQIPDRATAVDEALVSGETRARVRAVLAELPSKDAEIIRALFFEEREKDEICRAFGVDRNYLRVLLHRAKERFRQQYRRGGEIRPIETARGKPSLQP
jgi:RNA polymerase sigma-70 factor, ECF subfamily